MRSKLWFLCRLAVVIQLVIATLAPASLADVSDAGDPYDPVAQEPPVPLTPGTMFRDCDYCPDMMVLPPGTFTMGSPVTERHRGSDEGPAHQVSINVPFAVGVYEVTVAEFASFVAETGHDTGDACVVYAGTVLVNQAGSSWRNPGFSQSPSEPVVCVSWDDAQAYVRWLTRETNQHYRLLSESEWEYAARAGTTTRFHYGDDPTFSELCGFVNGPGFETPFGRRHVACRDNFPKTAPVGSFPPNQFGLHDLHGNVWELVEDCFARRYGGQDTFGQPIYWEGCLQRSKRGGSWSSSLGNLRSADRWWTDPALRVGSTGFRVARRVLDLVAQR